MKDADLMTPKELRVLAEQKEDEEKYKVVKTGELKHDLYEVDRDKIKYELDKLDFWITKDTVDKFVDNIFKEPILTKGAIFEAMYDGKCLWFDTDGGWIAEVGDDWANEHLTNIKEVGKK